MINCFGALSALSKCLTIINEQKMPYFSSRRWSSTVSTGCMTFWPRRAWRRPPTSTLAPSFWGAHSPRAAMSSSPPPSSLWSWEISCCEFSQMWNRAVGKSAVPQAVGKKCIAHMFYNNQVQESSAGPAVLCLLPLDTDPTSRLKLAF